MRKNSKKRILTGLAAFSYAFTTASPTALAISESKMVLSQSLADTVKSTIQLPEKFTNIAIGNEGAGNSYYNSELKEFHIEGSGGQIGKDTGKTDSYQLVSHEVKGDAAIVARLKDFDMTNAPYGQAGVILRSDDENNNADYLAVYVEPSKNEYRYAFRDTTKEATGAATLNGLSSDMKDLYIKIVKTGTSFNFYISQNENFDSMLAQGGQTIQAEHDNWNAGFVVGNGNSSDIATATFDNVEITDSTGVIYTTKEVSNDVVEDYKEEAVTEVYLPKKFVDSHIGNNNSIGVSNFIKGDKEFVINGSGNFIGKDTNSTDNYQFVSYEVKGDAYITARLKDFDMTNAKNGQAGVFVRSDNSSNNADYFGVYVEPSKNQYRYAYRDKSAGKSGAAAISGLTADDKDKYIKIEKEGTSFRYSISDDMTFPEDTTLTNTQTVSSSSDTWHFGFVVSNGGSTSSAKAIFDNVKIGTAIGAYYDSTLELRSVETVENLQAIASDAEVNLTWDSVEEADKYIIKRSIQADGEYETIAIVDSNINSYKDSNLINFRTYYYKIAAANGEGESYDSAAVMALPNNSNKENIQYEENAAIFTMIEEPNDTTFNKDINIKGSTDKDGTISIKVNNVYIKENEVKNNGEMFEENITLQPGRNEIEISQVTAEGKKSLKTYNIVYLTNESFQIMVDKNYTGEEGLHLNGVKVYNSITKAIESVSTKNKKRVTIFVRNGEYKEKATVAAPYISIVGEDSEKTIWTFDDANATINPETGEKYGTSKSASVTVKKSAAGFTAENITFENSLDEQGLVEGEQAVALNNQADKSIFINCRFLGNQDTLLADASKTSPSRQYYYNCYIEGDVDFIFGRAQAVFDNCDIASYNKNSVNNGYITAADTWDKDPYGYLIMNSRLIGLDNIKGETVSLGRPWRPSSVTETMTPSVVYVNNYMGNHISTKGWDDMGVNSLAKDSRFFEFASFGPGARLSNTRNVLDLEEAAEYTMENVFSKGAAKTLDGLDAYAEDWNPSSVSSDINMHNLYKGNGEEFIPIILVESVSLDKTVIDCKIGYTDILTAAINPDNASNKEITWSSSDESVVSVDENGNITALKAGIAEIKAAVDGKEAVCTVNVTTDEKPEIIAEDLVVYLKDKFDAKNYVEAIDLEDGNITDKVVVKENTVNTSRVGTYKVIYEITDTDNNTTVKEISVQVKKPVLVSRISLEKTSLTLDNGQSYKMNAAVSPSNASRPELKWSSSNENVAVVDSEGNVTATGKGTTYIYANATDGSRKKVYAMVTVVQRVESIKINNEDSVLKTGDSLQLSAALNPNTANNKTVYWSSSNNSAVTVSRTGKVTAVGAGTATITVRSADGGKEDTITIIVKDSIKSVELNKGLLTLSKRNNESYNLIATINSPNAQVRSIEWSSSNTNIVKVDGNGKVTAVGRGMTKVTVTVTGELGEKVTESCLVVVL